jgi:sulfate/thiosulfate transport system ATP-binding protein
MSVVIENVTKRFTLKGTPAVHDATFEAVDGGITTLLGPSGSGKTTLLRIIAGLETSDTGRVLVEGKDIIQVPVRKRGFGFVFQSFALFNHLTVAENISFGMEAQGKKGAQVAARVKELLSLVQLEGYGGRFPLQLSGGQRQRVGFARALACRPRVLLLDEPFGALDTRVRVELREWLAELHESTHITTILVTHDQEEALELSQRIVVMDLGRVVQVGSPKEVYDEPATAFVASFVGSANVLKGKVEGKRATLGALEVTVGSDVPDGTNVQAIVRPHNVRLNKNGVEHHERSVGTVTRMVPLGPYVKLQLSLPSNEAVTVQLPRGEAESMGLAVGDKVIVDLADAKVFVEDYSI